MSRQSQRGGKDSKNIQVQGDLNVGLSYKDVRQIAQDVYKANFIELRGEARKIAVDRINSFILKLISALKSKDISTLNSFIDPDMQYALWVSQRDYARSGSEELGDVLVNLLIERASNPERTITQILINEAIEKTSRLASFQYNDLSLIFLVGYMQFFEEINDFDSFIKTLNTFYIPLIPSLKSDTLSFKHLEQIGCSKSIEPSRILEDLFLSRYPGLFMKGYPTGEFLDHFGKLSQKVEEAGLFIACFHNPDLIQLSPLTHHALRTQLEKLGMEEQAINEIHNFQGNYRMNQNEAKQIIIDKLPEMQKIFKHWVSNNFSGNVLTSVGYIIGHANIRRLTGIFLDYSKLI